MKVDITELLIIFDDFLPITNEEEGIYGFQFTRSDGVFIILSFSIRQESVVVSVHPNEHVQTLKVNLKNCSEIRVLDEKKKCLEILIKEDKGRCFLSLTAESIMDFSEHKQSE